MKLEAIEAMAYTENAIMDPNYKIKIQDEQKIKIIPKMFLMKKYIYTCIYTWLVGEIVCS